MEAKYNFSKELIKKLIRDKYIALKAINKPRMLDIEVLTFIVLEEFKIQKYIYNKKEIFQIELH